MAKDAEFKTRNFNKTQKTRLRDASEHNMPSFRATGKKWLDPAKESLTDEMTDYIDSLVGIVKHMEIRSGFRS